MRAGLRARLRKLEDLALVGEDRQEIERRRRLHYNLIGVSDAALMADIAATLSGVVMPDWAKQELEAPIPLDAPKALIQAAEEWARRCSGLEHSLSDEELHRELLPLHEEARRAGFENLADYAESLRYSQRCPLSLAQHFRTRETSR